VSLVYLASPYSHADPTVREARFQAVCAAAGRMMEAGQIVYSPIAHSHPISQTMNVSPVDHDFWLRQCFGVLEHSTKLVVLMLDGWGKSRGVAAEIVFAAERGIPVEFTKA
jgi:hypothetical protein